MRMTQDVVKYEPEVKQTPVHVLHKINTYKTWDIDHSNHNSYMSLYYLIK